MKKTKKLSVLAAAALGACVCVTAAACSNTDNTDGHTHTYGSWSITTNPTVDAGGVVTGTCAEDNATTTENIPALSDTEFWTVTPTAPTHVDAGYTTYSSSKYNVSIRVDGDPAVGHDWGDWSFKDGVKPTKDTGATIVRTCKSSDGGVEEKPVPALLADTSFWTAGDPVAPGHTSVGTQDFTNAEHGLKVTVETPAVGHDWGDWSFKDGEKPTKTTGATIVRTCKSSDGGVEEKPVPALLADTSFWTAGVAVQPGHASVGTQDFTNAEHGLKVTVETPAVGHNWGDWSFVAGNEPDEDNGGKIKRVCPDDNAEEVLDVKKLSDESEWARKDVPADYNHGGYKLYSYKNSKIQIEKRVSTGEAKLVAPYDNKTYYALNFAKLIDQNINKSVNIESSYGKASITLGGETCNEAIGEAYPYRNTHVKIEMVDPETGKVNITMVEIDDPSAPNPVAKPGVVPAQYVGYVNMSDGGVPVIVFKFAEQYFVLTDKTTTERVDIEGVPTQVPIAYQAGTVASAWTFKKGDNTEIALAVNYKHGEQAGDVLNFYIEEDGNDFTVHFGTAFKKSDNTVVAADAIYGTQDAVYITADNGDAIASFGFKNGKMQILDGYEGTYTGTINTYAQNGYLFYDKETPVVISDATAILDGMGGMTVSYTVPEEGDQTLNARYVVLDGGKIGIYILMSEDPESQAIQYLETTAVSTDDKTFACKLDLVKMSTFDEPVYDDEYNVTGHKNGEYYVCKNLQLPIGGSDLSSGLIGLYLDAGFTQELKDITPTADFEAHFRWSEDYIEFVTDDGTNPQNTHRVYFVDGMSVKDVFPNRIDTVTDTHYIVGWFTQAEGGEQVALDAALSSADKGQKLYAHWAEIPDYVGVYNGRQLTSASSHFPAQLEIKIDGTIEGSIFTGLSKEKAIVGTVQSCENGIITYKADNGATGLIWIDGDVIVIPEELNSTNTDSFPFMLTKNSHVGIVGNEKLGLDTNRTHLIGMSDNSFVLIHMNNVTAGLTAQNAFGAELTSVDQAFESKTIVLKKGNEVILAVGSTAEKYSDSKDILDKSAEKKLLDNIYGTYAQGSTTIKIDGVGGLTNSDWESMSIDGKRTYCKYEIENTAENGDITLGVYVYVIDEKTEQSSGGLLGDDDDYGYGSDSTNVVKTAVNKQYWRIAGLKVGEKTIDSCIKVEASLTYNANKPADAAGMDDVADSTVTININIPYSLTVDPFTVPDADDNYVFDGWYNSPDCSGDALTSVTLGDAGDTVYAKWIEKMTVTFKNNLGDGDDTDFNIAFTGKGKTLIMIDEPNNTVDTTKMFAGWYTEAACTNVWESGKTIVTDSIALFAKWVKADYAGTFVGAVGIGIKNTSAAGDANLDDRSLTLTVTAQGSGSGTSYPFSGDINLSDYDESTGKFLFTKGSSTYNGMADHNGFLFINRASGVESPMTEVWMFSPFSSGASELKSEIKSVYWDNGKNKVIKYTHSGTTYYWLLIDGELYSGDALVDTNDNAVDISKSLEQRTLVLKNDGNTVLTVHPTVAVTVIYGNDVDSITKNVTKGMASPDLFSVNYKNGKKITGYYTTENFEEGTEVDFATIDGDITIYAKWEAKPVYEVSFKDGYVWTLDEDTGVWSSGGVGGNYGEDTNSSDNTMYLSFNADVIFEFSYAASCEYSSDYLRIKNDTANQTLIDKAGAKVDLANQTYANLKIEVKSGDVISFNYHKNSSVIKNDDRAEIKGLIITVKEYVPVTLTYDYNGQGTSADVENYTSYDTISTVKSVDFKNGSKVFAGWFTENGVDENWGEEYVGGQIIKNTTVYAKWIEPHALMGVYKGYEFSTSISSSVRTTTIDLYGIATATGGYGTFNATDVIYDENTGSFIIGTASNGRYGYYDAQTQTIVYRYSSSSDTTKLNNDVFVCIKADNVSSASSPNFVYWTDDTLTVTDVKLGKFKVGDVEKYFFVYNNKVYGDVTVSAVNASGQAVIAMSDFKKEGVVLTISRNNTQLFKGAYKGSTFVGSDGLAGTYSGDYGDIVTEGYGTLTVGTNTTAASYTKLEDNKITFVLDSRMYIVSLGDGAYTKVLDGYEGTYNLPDDAGTVVLDGYGVATVNNTDKVYNIAGGTITIFDPASDTSETYGITKDSSDLIGKSVFAGMSFKGSYSAGGFGAYAKINFDDAASLTGQLLIEEEDDITNRWCAYNISAVLNGTTLTVTVVSKADVTGYNSSLTDAVGKTFTMEYNSDANPATLKFISTPKLGYVSSTLNNVTTKLQ